MVSSNRTVSSLFQGLNSADPTGILGNGLSLHASSLNAGRNLEQTTAAELTRIKEAFGNNPTGEESRQLLVQSRKTYSTVVGHGRSFDDTLVIATAEMLFASGECRNCHLASLSHVLATRLRTKDANVDEVAKFLMLVVSRGYSPYPLVTQLCTSIASGNPDFSDSTRHALVPALSQSELKSSALMKYLFRSTVWAIAELRKKNGAGEEALQSEAKILNIAAAGLNLGDAMLLNLTTSFANQPDRKLPSYGDCEQSIRYEILTRYDEGFLTESESFRRLLDQEFLRIKRAHFCTALTMTAELLAHNLSETTRKKVCENLRGICDKVDIEEELANVDNALIIVSYEALLSGGFYHPGFHTSFENIIDTRLCTPGRQSRTTQVDGARLCEIAATVTTCSSEFKAVAVQRADEHLVTALDDKKSAFQLMTYIAYLAPDKWEHVVTQLKAISENIRLTLTPEAARCFYLLSRMAGLPCYEVNLINDTEPVLAGHTPSEKSAEYLARVWEKITRPQGDVEQLGIRLGILDVFERGRRSMVLLEPEHPSTTQPVRDLSQIYEELFSEHAPDIRVSRITIPKGSEDERETALRKAVFLAVYNEELGAVSSEQDVEEGGRLVEFD